MNSNAIENKLDKMALKQNLKSREMSILQNTKIHIAEAFNPLQSDICDIRMRLDATDIRISRFEELWEKSGAGKDMGEIRQMFETLEK